MALPKGQLGQGAVPLPQAAEPLIPESPFDYLYPSKYATGLSVMALKAMDTFPTVPPGGIQNPNVCAINSDDLYYDLYSLTSQNITTTAG